MIPPTPGASPASRLFGSAVPEDGGPAIGPDQYWPQPASISFGEVLSGLNPLQHLPGIGMIYRAATGSSCPPAMLIGGALVSGAVFGGPVGVIGTIAVTVLQEFLRLGPDTSGPAVPAGFAATGSEAGAEPVTPSANGTAPAIQFASDWQATQFLEHGMA